MPTIEPPSVKHILSTTPPLLKIKYEKTTVTTPAVYLPRAEAAKTPTLLLSQSLITPGTTYLAVAIDLDAPFPSAPILGPILHGIQTGLVPEGDADADGFVTLKAEVDPIVHYIGPAPPPLSSPHRYIMLIWKQEGTVSVESIKKGLGWEKPISMTGRMWWDELKFEDVTGLKEVPIAGNYFTSN
jgi:hypothetical protein